MERRNLMRQTKLFAAAAAAALILACVAGCPFQVMVSAKRLPTERIADYSFVFAD
jgi:hypothetical protein